MSRSEVQPLVKEEKRAIFKMSGKDLFVLASTSGGVGVFFSGLAVFASQFSNVIPYGAIYEEIVVFIRFGALIVALAVFVVLLIAWIVSVVLTFINYYEFTITVEDEEIIITRGLLEKKKITIPLSRIQGVQVVENPLRQLIGYATVIVDSAGGSLAEKDEKIRLLPLIKKTKITPILQEIFPELPFNPDSYENTEKVKKVFLSIRLYMDDSGCCSS